MIEMGRITVKKYEDEDADNTVLLSVQQREGEGKVNNIIIVDDIDEADEMNGEFCGNIA